MCDDQIRKRLIELAKKAAQRRGTVFSDFLNIAELAVFHTLPKASFAQVDVALYGGAADCERQMIRFAHPDTPADPFPIVCIQIKPSHPKFSQALSHRDVLGALMSLGFDRSLLGDIFLQEKHAFVFSQQHIASYICDNLQEISRTRVTCAIVPQPQDGLRFTLQPLIVQASSARIDAVLAKVFKLSRSDSQKLFSSRLVFINGKVCENTSYLLKPDDLVSVRKQGRFRFRGVASLSKKGKENIAVDLYV